MFAFTFTKPTKMTNSQKKNKQKASARAREREYWAEWSRQWDYRRSCLHLTFRLWSKKEKHLSKKKDWVSVVQKRPTIPEFVQRSHVWSLKKIMGCLSIKDISLDFSNELIDMSHEEYQKEKQRMEKKQHDQKRLEEYIDIDVVSMRQKKQTSRKRARTIK